MWDCCCQTCTTWFSVQRFEQKCHLCAGVFVVDTPSRQSLMLQMPLAGKKWIGEDSFYLSIRMLKPSIKSLQHRFPSKVRSQLWANTQGIMEICMNNNYKNSKLLNETRATLLVFFVNDVSPCFGALQTLESVAFSHGCLLFMNCSSLH